MCDKFPTFLILRQHLFLSPYLSHSYALPSTATSVMGNTETQLHLINPKDI